MIIDFKKIDFGLATITLTSLFAGLLLYCLTAPFWDSPPMPDYFPLKRLAWFPICEIFCLISFTSIYGILKYPSLRNVSKLFLNSFISLNLAIIFVFFGSDIYQTRTISFERYLNGFPNIFYIIVGINIVSLISFGFFLFLSFILERIFNPKKLF